MTNEIPILTGITPAKAAAAVKVLVDNGIEPDEAETVLQAVGYALLDLELAPVLPGLCED